MSVTRLALANFMLANEIYRGCSVTVWKADVNGIKTAVKATLYDSPTGTGTLANPQILDGEGKFKNPVYIADPVVLETAGLHVATHTTGMISPPGNWRGDWATATTLFPGDFVRDGAAGTNTKNVYVVVNYHVSGTWAADVADATKLALVIDYVTLTSTVVSDASETVKGKAELATQAETDTGTDDARIVTPLKLKSSVYNPNGKHLIPLLASGMQPATTNGAAAGVTETATNKVLYRTLDFDATTQEFAGFVLPMPKSWNEGAVTFRALWTAASGSGGVAWALQGTAFSDDDALDTAYGTEQVVTDTLLSAGDLHRTAESTAITIAGSPAASDLVAFRVKRVPANVSDTLGVDAKLIGIELFITTDAGTDA